MGFYAFSGNNGVRPEDLPKHQHNDSFSTHAHAHAESRDSQAHLPSLVGGGWDKTGRRMYLMTSGHAPFCAWHYRVTIVLSDTRQSLRQGGDR